MKNPDVAKRHNPKVGVKKHKHALRRRETPRGEEGPKHISVVGPRR